MSDAEDAQRPADQLAAPLADLEAAAQRHEALRAAQSSIEKAAAEIARYEALIEALSARLSKRESQLWRQVWEMRCRVHAPSENGTRLGDRMIAFADLDSTQGRALLHVCAKKRSDI